MKSVDAALATHTAQDVTTLAWCLRIEREDKEKFYFTSHNEELTVDLELPDGAQVYSPSNSFRAFSVKFTDDLSVDGSEIIAIISDNAIAETDVLRGLFDYAEWRLFIVNWAAPTSGFIKIGRGKLGEVTLRSDFTLKAELRGLVQLLRQKSIVRSIRLEDDSDLGDDRNKVPIWPDEVERNTAYSLNDYVRATDNSPRNTTPLVGINLDFEAGDLTGWTTNTGTPQAGTGRDGLSPFEGSFLLAGTKTGGDYEVEQIIDLDDSANNLDTAKIDAGDYLFSFSVRCGQSQTTGIDDHHIKLEWLNAASVLISTPFDEQGAFGIADSWGKVDGLSIAIPANARKLRITLGGVDIGSIGSDMTAFFDKFIGEFSDISGTGAREVYLPLANPTFGWAAMTTGGSVREWTVTAGPWQADNIEDALSAVYTPFFLRASGGGAGSRSLNQTATIPTDAIPIAEIDAGDVNFIFPAAVANHVPSDPDTYRLLIEALDASDNLVQVIRNTGDTGFTVYDEWIDISLDAPLPIGARKIRITWEVDGFNVFVNNGYPYFVRTTANLFTADNYNDRIYRCTTAGTTGEIQPTYDSIVGNTTADGSAVFEAEESWTRAVTVASVDGSESRRIFTVTQLDPGSAGSFAPHQGFPDDWFNYGGFTFETGDNAGVTVEIKDFIGTDSAGEQTITLAFETPFDISVGDKGRCYPGWNKTREQLRDKFDPNAYVVYNDPGSGLTFRGFPDLPGEGFLNRAPDFKPGTQSVSR